MELIRIEEIPWSGFATLIKGAGHKYVKREIKDVGPPKKYRYWYKHPRAGIVTDSALHVGAKFAHGTGDRKGHYEVVMESPIDGRFRIRHDETGEIKMMSAAELKQFMHSHHDDARMAGYEKRKEAFIAAWKNGTDKQVAARKKDVLDWAQGYWGQTTNTENFIRRVESETERRITPLRSRQRQSAEDKRRAKAQQDQILERITGAIRMGDNDGYRQAREAWAKHRKDYGALSSGYRQKVAAARKEAERNRSEIRNRGRNRRAALRNANNAREAYQTRSSAWARDALPEGINTRNTPEEVARLLVMRGAPGYKNKIATFGGARVEGMGYSLTVYNSDGAQVTTGFNRSVSGTEIPMTPTEVKGTTMHAGAPYFDLHNDYLKIDPKVRGGEWNAQKLYARQEDWVKEATDHLSARDKQNVTVTILADINVGKYYWATQGFRYQRNGGWNGRVSHLENMVSRVDNLLNGNNRALTLKPLKQDGSPVDIDDLGYTPEVLRAYRDKLQAHKEKAEDASVPNDQKVEPWELVEDTPPGDKIWVMNLDWEAGMPDNKKFIPCTLSKFIMLNSKDWEAAKHVHGPTERDRQGIDAGDRRRAQSAARDAKAGKPWPWLGDDVNNKLKELAKSVRLGKFGTRTLQKALRGPAHFAFAPLEKADPDAGHKKIPDGITVDELPDIDQEMEYSDALMDERQEKLLDDAIKLYDEMLKLPDESAAE